MTEEQNSAVTKTSTLTLDGGLVLPEGAPTGFEGVSQSDLGIPRVILCQKGSRWVDPTHAKASVVPGAMVGDIILDSEARILAKGLGKGSVYVIPAGYRKVHLEFNPRNQGGGLVHTHLTPPADVNVVTDQEGKRSYRRANGNEMRETAVFGVLIQTGEEWAPAVLSMAGGNLSTARQWLNRAMAIKKPLYTQAYALGSRAESKAGNSYTVYTVEYIAPIKKQAVLDQAYQAHIDFSKAHLENQGTESEAF